MSAVSRGPLNRFLMECPFDIIYTLDCQRKEMMFSHFCILHGWSNTKQYSAISQGIRQTKGGSGQDIIYDSTVHRHELRGSWRLTCISFSNQPVVMFQEDTNGIKGNVVWPEHNGFWLLSRILCHCYTVQRECVCVTAKGNIFITTHWSRFYSRKERPTLSTDLQ